MRNIRKLNDKQRKLIEDNYGLIWCIHDEHFRKFTDLDTYKDVANIAICKAALKWDESKGDFGSLLYWQLRSEINKYYTKWHTQKETMNRIAESLETVLPGFDNDKVTVKDTIASSEDIEDDVVTRLHFQNEFNKLSDRTKKIVWMMAQGLSQRDIAKEFGKSHQWVSLQIVSFKKKLCC